MYSELKPPSAPNETQGFISEYNFILYRPNSAFVSNGDLVFYGRKRLQTLSKGHLGFTPCTENMCQRSNSEKLRLV